MNDRVMETNAAADALYDALHTRIHRAEFREIYARLAATSTLDLSAARAEAQRLWPDGAEGVVAEMYRREVRAAFERGAAWQSRSGTHSKDSSLKDRIQADIDAGNLPQEWLAHEPTDPVQDGVRDA